MLRVGTRVFQRSEHYGMNVFPPIFAAGWNDLIGWLVVLLFIIVPVIGQLLAKLRQAQPPAGGGRPQRPAPVPVDVTDEIDVFMHRVLGRQDDEETPPIRNEPAPVERPLEAEVVAEEPGGGRVVEHVEKYFNSQEFSRRAGRLGGEVVQADEKLEQRLHRTFDHKLGQLGTTAVEPSDIFGTAAVEIPPTFAAGWAAMLSNTDSVRQAIVLSEIIHRPEERWA